MAFGATPGFDPPVPGVLPASSTSHGDVRFTHTVSRQSLVQWPLPMEVFLFEIRGADAQAVTDRMGTTKKTKQLFRMWLGHCYL